MAGRTALAYLQTLLDEEWEEEIDGRIETVPKPYILLAGDSNTTRVSQLDGDVLFITDGGPQSISPKSVGWDHREVESLATVDIRTQRGRGRLEGVRDDNNEAERYGGLRGEVQRVLDLVRRGDKEYDLINGYEWNDLSEEIGFQFWRGTFEVRLTQVAEEIDPEP